MPTVLRAFVLFPGLCVACAALGWAQQPPVFRAGTRLVSLFVTVTDAQKRLVPNLVVEDFEVLDNEQPQPIVVFDNTPQPITSVVMLDTSLSMTNRLDDVRDAAEQFFLRLLPADQGVAGAFNSRVEIEGDFTSDRDALVASLAELDYGNGTKLYDALWESMDRLEGVDGRRVIVVFTDGDDTSSRVGGDRVLDRARAREVMIYAIGMETELSIGPRRMRTNPDRTELPKLAAETGGGYFKLKKDDELGPTFTRVAQELHSQYLIGFAPAALDGKVHKLMVRVKHAGMAARARRTYLASAESTTSGGPAR